MAIWRGDEYILNFFQDGPYLYSALAPGDDRYQNRFICYLHFVNLKAFVAGRTQPQIPPSQMLERCASLYETSKNLNRLIQLSISKLDRPALVLIDIQKGFDNIEYWGGQRNNPSAEINASELLKIWRENSLPIYISNIVHPF